MPLPTFIERPRFDLPRGWLYDVQAEDDVEIVRRGKERERRNLYSDRAITRISVTIPRDRVSDIALIRSWHRVARSRLIGFRVQDPSDYMTTQLGYAVDASDPQPTPLDQPLIEAEEGSGVRFQLYRQYAIGEGSSFIARERPIYKPVASTIRVANELGDEQPPNRWTLDDTTGVLTVGVGFVGIPTTWGGQFDLPMRFDSPLPLRVEDFRIDETSFELIELPEFA